MDDVMTYIPIEGIDVVRSDLAPMGGARGVMIASWHHVRRTHLEELDMQRMFDSLDGGENQWARGTELWLICQVASRTVVVGFVGYDILSALWPDGWDGSGSGVWDEMGIIYSVDGGPPILRGPDGWNGKLWEEIK